MNNKIIFSTAFTFILILILSQISLASKYNNISIEENIVPGALKLTLSSDKELNVISFDTDDGILVLDVDNLSVRRSITHQIKTIPFIRSVTIQKLSDKTGRVTINMKKSFSYDYTPEVNGNKLTVLLSGEFIDYAASEQYEWAEKHRRSGNDAAALESYRKAIRLQNGDYPKAFFGIGLIRKQNNQNDLAIISFNNSLHDDELKNGAHLHLSELYGKIERFDLQELHFSLSQGEEIEIAGSEAVKNEKVQLFDFIISWESARSFLLAGILLSPLAILLLLFMIARSKNKKIPISKRFKKELEKQLQSSNGANTNLAIQTKATPQVPEKEISGKYIDDYTDIDIHLKSMAHKYKQNSHDIIKTIRSLSNEKDSKKSIAQKLLISESEVEMIQGMNETSYNFIIDGVSAFGNLPDSLTSSRELARDLHRDEEGVMLTLLADEKGNG